MLYPSPPPFHSRTRTDSLLADCLGSSGEVAAVIAANGTQYAVFPEYFVEAPTFVSARHPRPPCTSTARHPWATPIPSSLQCTTRCRCDVCVQFKRGGTYYVMYGHCCCFCMQGSGLFVYTATSPLGPWRHQPVRVDGAAEATPCVLCGNQCHPLRLC